MRLIWIVLALGFCPIVHAERSSLNDETASVKFELSLDQWRHALVKLNQDVGTLPTIAGGSQLAWLSEANISFQGAAVWATITQILPTKERSRPLTERVKADIYQRHGLRCLNDHSRTFETAEKKTGVSRYGIAALLTLETLCGLDDVNIVPYHPALATIASHAIMAQADIAEALYQQLKEKMALSVRDFTEQWPAGARNKWLGRMQNKFGQPWVTEVRRLFEVAVNLAWTADNLDRLGSSWAGAIGIAQFLPSTLHAAHNKTYPPAKRYLDPTHIDDAIELVGWQLQFNGWHNNQQRAFAQYNSGWNVYGQALVTLMGILSEAEQTQAAAP